MSKRFTADEKKVNIATEHEWKYLYTPMNSWPWDSSHSLMPNLATGSTRDHR